MQATSMQMTRLHNLVKNGSIRATKVVVKQGVRLDHLAGRQYGDGRLWWVIAAATGIGWWMQVPPGTVLKVPTDINEVISMIG